MISVATASSRYVALTAALLALACQKDGDALFDNANLSDSVAGSMAGSLGAASSGGDTGSAGSSTGGGSSEPGEGGSAAKAGGSSAGTGNNEGGNAGSGSAGTAGQGGSGGDPGTAGMAGHAGSKPDPTPEPVTVLISEFEDAHVVSCDAFDTHGSGPTIEVDGDMNDCVYQGLLQPLLDQIPGSALVSKATLTLYCVNFGTPIVASYVNQAWKESTVTWSERPSAGDAIGEIACEEIGPVTIDLTNVLTTWLTGGSPYGLYLRGEGMNGIDFASSEAENADHRPQLSVTYVLPVK